MRAVYLYIIKLQLRNSEMTFLGVFGEGKIDSEKEVLTQASKDKSFR